MNMKKILSLMLLMAAVCGLAKAHDFVVTLNGQKVYFNIVSEKNRTVEITYNGSIADGKPTYYEGELAVPAKVRHNNTIYSVAGIGAKAFCGADRLTGIVLPEGLKAIGDFAFEGCTSLERIIFPGGSVNFGEGVFFKCDKIQDVSFGSDWKEVDLKMFRWSDSLMSITIPAKMEKIINMKSLKHLETVSVDINNGRFSSVDGILYNKGGNTLYGCPRAYAGVLKVAEGTETITPGAFIDCKYIVKADLPASLVSMSFREFSRMPGLETVILRSETPVNTAKGKDGEVFLLQVASPDVQIVIPKKAKKAYEAAMAKEPGEYSDLSDDRPFLVEKDRMPGVKNLKAVNNFSKY